MGYASTRLGITCHAWCADVRHGLRGDDPHEPVAGFDFQPVEGHVAEPAGSGFAAEVLDHDVPAEQSDAPLPVGLNRDPLAREQPAVFEIEFADDHPGRRVRVEEPAGDDPERGGVRQVRLRELVGRLREVQPDPGDGGERELPSCWFAR